MLELGVVPVHHFNAVPMLLQKKVNFKVKFILQTSFFSILFFITESIFYLKL